MRLRNFISLAAAFILAAVSCGKENTPEEKSFEVSPLALDVEALGGNVSVSVTSPDDWFVRSDASWAKVLTASGKGSSSPSEVSISVDENTGSEQRSAKITVKTLKGDGRDVTLIQSGNNGEATRRGISTAEELTAFAEAVNSGASLNRYMVNGIVKLTADIDASSIKEWVPAGTAERPLTYSIDGGGHHISGINWTVDITKYPCGGLVGYARNVTVSDIVLEGTAFTFKGQAAKASLGAFVGYAEGATMTMLENKVNVLMTGNSASGQDIALGGICGFADAGSTMGGELKRDGCTNSAAVMTPSSCSTGGLAGRNEGKMSNNTNSGSILGKASSDGSCGPGWACGYNGNYGGFVSNFGYGHVGDYSAYADAPEKAAPALFTNAVACPEKSFDITANTVDWTLDEYYDWKEVETKSIRSGLTYHHYSCTGIPRQIHVLEVDLTDGGIDITTSYADDIVPNPNGNNNGNNGKNIRETLSELCARKRREGMNVIAGINTGFFDSNDGISRGFHVEDGEPVYINSPSFFKSQYHVHGWGFTVFEDRTMSCGKKTFSGKIQAGGSVYDFHTVNDTTLRHVSKSYPVNVYTSRYVQYPHPEKKTLVNRLAANALYVVARYTDSPMKVNCGYAEATVTAIYDGRTAALANPPYLTGRDEVAIALSGAKADSFSAAVKTGDKIKLRCDIGIISADGAKDTITKPIRTQNSSAYYLMKEGADYSQTPGAAASVHSKFDPMTFPVLSRDGRKVWLVVVDGRQDWYSTGVKGYEVYRIAKKLGGWNCTRFDGGGSSCMWLYSDGDGKIMNSVSDSRGERSCLNYLLITEK